MASEATVYVYNNRDNLAQAKFTKDGSAIDFTDPATTRMTLELVGSGVTIDTDSLATDVDIIWTSSGVVQFDIGHAGVPAGTYQSRLVRYTAAFDDGETLTHEDGDVRLVFKVLAS